MIRSMDDHDDAPKSALELAMARLRQKDADSGETQHPLTDEQKARIAEVTERMSSQRTARKPSLMTVSVSSDTSSPPRYPAA